jgi:NDP-sugar pyrophosphorylase family protein
MILAAGKGSRLGNLTLSCPKPLLPIADRPVLAYTIDWLRRYNITDIAINLHHVPEVVQDHFGNGQIYDVNIHYSIEETLLGTAGALTPLVDFFDTTFVVVYGDVLTNFNLAAMLAFHRCKQSKFTIALYRVADPSRCGVVDLDKQQRIRRFIEKPKPEEVFTNLANAGVYLLEPAILDNIPQNQIYDFGHDLYPRLLSEDVPLYGYPLKKEYLIDMGTPETYQQAQVDYAQGKF